MYVCRVVCVCTYIYMHTCSFSLSLSLSLSPLSLSLCRSRHFQLALWMVSSSLFMLCGLKFDETAEQVMTSVLVWHISAGKDAVSWFKRRSEAPSILHKTWTKLSSQAIAQVGTQAPT